MDVMRHFIAVVDDEEPVRKALRRLFLSADIDVEVFASGEEFLGALGAEAPTCLVLDLHMPGLDGRGVLRELRGRGATFPTVIVTAYDEPGSEDECLAAGAAAYLRKPLDDRLLIETIDRTIGDRARGADPRHL
jgi:FixJ family two-component response regulator